MNVTKPDCVLLSERAIIAIELKFNAKTSVEQIAKYATVLAADELHYRQRDRLGVLYIYPTDASKKFERETGLVIGIQKAETLDSLSETIQNVVVHEFVKQHRSALRSVMERLTVACITWVDIHHRLIAYIESLGDGKGDRTLKIILGGLADEISRHPLSKVGQQA